MKGLFPELYLALHSKKNERLNVAVFVWKRDFSILRLRSLKSCRTCKGRWGIRHWCRLHPRAHAGFLHLHVILVRVAVRQYPTVYPLLLCNYCNRRNHAAFKYLSSGNVCVKMNKHTFLLFHKWCFSCDVYLQTAQPMHFTAILCWRTKYLFWETHSGFQDSGGGVHLNGFSMGCLPFWLFTLNRQWIPSSLGLLPSRK